MPVILLIRHGQASFGKPDYDKLSPIGHEQAGVLGRSLQRRIPAAHLVVRGEMRRHRETAEGCLRAMGAHEPASPYPATPRVVSGFNEFDARDMIRRHDPLGLSRLMTAAKILKDRQARVHFEALFAEAMRRWTSGKHDGDYEEPWHVFAGRCNDAVDRLAKELEHGETAIVFTSAGPISAVAQRCLGLDGEQVQRLSQTLVNAGTTKLVVGQKGPQLSTLNEHAIFEPDAHRLLTYR